jgi:hypothetical protein
MEDLRVVWSKVDAARRLIPFLIIEFGRRDYEKFWGELRNNVERCVFLAKKLEGRRVRVRDVDGRTYVVEFPPYYDKYGRKDSFWYNNVFETYEEVGNSC